MFIGVSSSFDLCSTLKLSLAKFAMRDTAREMEDWFVRFQNRSIREVEDLLRLLN